MKGLEWTFDTVAEEYDKWRPEYVPELYSDIFWYTNIFPESHALEIGIGTGQATKPILETGCSVIAVEPGKNLAELTRENFKLHHNLTVVNSSFQSFVCENESFDLIYSASAFHWIDEEEGYRKVYHLLKPGGTFARFASHPFNYIEGQEELSDKIETIYFKYMPRHEGETSPKPRYIYNEVDAKKRSEIALKYGFCDIKTHVYYRDLVYTSEEYIKRIGIECDKIAMDSSTRKQLLNDISNAIDEYGGKIIIRDMIDLNLARKL
ncbi:class I SAM-dependent methyltransferase [Anaeromicropila herbilytica]|nr:class I SAM-dependent methyltransferase [Anaeromicropila herbilytica]